LRRARDVRIYAARPPVAGAKEIASMGTTTTGQGSAGNVIAALCDLFFPGLGHLVQGRVLGAIAWFLAACAAAVVTWILTLGTFPFGWFVVSVFACISAATYRRRG
jgi:hypothetical protein